HLLGIRVELRNVERTARYAILASDAVVLLEIHDAVLILHDRVLGRARRQTPGIGAVHALVLAHQPGARTVGLGVLFELDQVPVIPSRFRHGLVGVLKRGLAERQIVPLQARHLARLAPDAGRGIDQLGDALLPLRALTRRRARMPGDALNAQR